MDKQILKQLEELQKSVASLQTAVVSIVASMATKDDLKRFATKDDLKRFATKDDLKTLVTKEDAKKFATKDDLTKALASHPTKTDLEKALNIQSKDICQVMTDLFTETDKIKASKKEFDALEKRVTILEQN